MNIEELRVLVAANSAPYEVYTYEGGLYPEGTVWGIGIPGVWDVFIEQEEHGQYPQLQAMVTLANAVPMLLARIDACAALERAVAAFVAHGYLNLDSEQCAAFAAMHSALNALRVTVGGDGS